MKTLTLIDGQEVAAIGQGTWHIGEQPGERKREVAALREGIELGMTLIDTAEMYAEGGAEDVVGAAIAGRREEVFLVSKVYPHNASRKGLPAACERSLRRLGCETIDLYLLHWQGRYPLEETIEAFERLRDQGKILRWACPTSTWATCTNWTAAPVPPTRLCTTWRNAVSNTTCCPGARSAACR